MATFVKIMKSSNGKSLQFKDGLLFFVLALHCCQKGKATWSQDKMYLLKEREDG